jgi:hypothetical protein
MPKKPTNKLTPQEREIPLVWNIPEDLISGYATNILVQIGEHEFFVSFFETLPPVILRPQDVDKLEKVTAECFARIVVAPERMQGFIDALQQQLNAFNEKKKAAAKAKVKANGSK